MREKYIILRTDPTQSAQSVTRGTGFRSSPGRTDAPLRFKLTVETLDSKEIADVTRDPSITAAPKMPVRLVAPRAVAMLPSDIDGPDIISWGLQATGALNSAFNGSGIAVGLLDTGVDASHPAFSGVHLEERDFTGEGPGDQYGHGTHCAGIFIGRAVDGTHIGVAPGVERAFMAKVVGASGTGDSALVMEGINWCVERGASIISLSLSFNFAGMVEELQKVGYPLDLATSHALFSYHQTMMLFERYAALLEANAPFGKGALLVAAVGNESRCDENPMYRLWADPPAAVPGVIAVAAVGEPRPDTGEYSLAPFSNWGADLVGPGVGIVSAAVGGGLCQMDGTSSATPHVAGLAALWAQKLLLLRGTLPQPDLLRQRLVGSGRLDLLAGDVRSALGAGLATAPER
ncbi:S8 family serine peptidase [Corallococcus exiguus]|uniref:S8 family serine peptidase n=1 Tax=Corallococcus exiguus TaxID=83462 RepID=UPI001560FEFB|nr:S8 family serine peptidase [Corallococcus exiguus]NRD65524.1 S8 family serine peptidase [Corallococcus exiguus]